MEEYILSSYCHNFIKDKKSYTRKISWLEKILAIVIVISAVAGFSLILFFKNSDWALVCVLSEMSAAIGLSRIDSKEKFEEKANQIDQIDNYYDEVKRWLFDIKYRDKS